MLLHHKFDKKKFVFISFFLFFIILSKFFVTFFQFKTSKDFNLCWNIENLDLLFQWFCYRDENAVFVNFNYYTKSNKLKTSQNLLKKTELNVLQFNIFKHKMRNKLVNIIKIYKKIWQLTNSTEWKINVIKHDIKMNNIYNVTIKKIMIKIFLILWIEKNHLWFVHNQFIFFDKIC